MKSTMLAGALILLTFSAVPARSQECLCEKSCARKSNPAACREACKEVCEQAAEKVRPQFAASANGKMDSDDTEKMTPEELDAWYKEYFQRRVTLEKKCKSVPDSDPNEAAIKDACQKGFGEITGKMRAIEKRKLKIKEDYRNSISCDNYRSLSDEDYCVTLRCGKCRRMGIKGTLMPLWKSDQLIEQQRREGEQRKERRERDEGTKGPGAGASIDCAAMREQHRATCAGATARTRPTKAECLANADRTAAAECEGLRTLKMDKGGR